MPDWSPYNYVFNNPIKFIDPDGMAPEDTDPPNFRNQQKSEIGHIENLNIHSVVNTGYPGQALDNLITEGIQFIANKISGSDVSLETSANIQLATNLAIVVISKGKNTNTNTKLAEQLTKAEARAAKLSEKLRPGLNMTKASKEAVIDLNKLKNGGKTVCETCRTNTIPATQSKKGITPSKKETNVDHIIPKAHNGSGTPNNGQVLCRDCNIKKSDKYIK